MAASAELLLSELNKIVKKDIIQALVYKKLADSIRSSSVLHDFFTVLCSERDTSDKVDENTFHDTMDDIHTVCNNIECARIKTASSALSKEVKLLGQTIYHMEKRLASQDDLILLLKQSNHIIKNSTPPKPPTGNMPNYATKLKTSVVNSTTQNQNKNQITLSQVNRAVQSAKDGTTLRSPANMPPATSAGTGSHSINNNNNNNNNNSTGPYGSRRSNSIQRNRRKPLIGANLTNTEIKSAPKQGFLHVYRLDPKTTCAELTNFLRQTAPDIQFECKDLNRTERGSSFLVYFPIQEVKKVYEPTIWPCGACVNRYRFPRASKPVSINTHGSNFPQSASQTPL